MDTDQVIKVRLILFLLLAAGVSGCATPNVIHERGWIGGTFIEARPSIFKRDYFEDPSGVIKHLPPDVKKQQRGALLVTRVYEGTPLAAADVREGDLILEANGTVILNRKSLTCVVREIPPGSTVSLTLYRDGERIERTVTVGKETFRRVKTLELGFGFGFDLDLFPNPDFSIFSLISYHRNDRPVKLRSPEWKAMASGAEGEPVFVRVWRFWCLIFGVGAQEAILSQEPDGGLGK